MHTVKAGDSASQALLDDVPYWFHSLRLPGDVLTAGVKTERMLDEEWQSLNMPPLLGLEVLDVGACDGAFSFRAEAAGAARVAALESSMWSDERLRILAQMVQGERWTPPSGELRAAFDVARQLLGSRVERVEADWLEIDLRELGTYDVVLLADVLHHMPDQLEALRRVRATTRRLAVIEAYGFVLPAEEDVALWRFALADEVRGDDSIWWVPNHRGLVDLCTAAGFREVRTMVGVPEGVEGSHMQECRLVVHALP